jgi:hypothetical protein
MPFAKKQIEKNIHKLIDEYEKFKRKKKERKEKLEEVSEANIRADFIDPLFDILGWRVRNPDEYDREKYVRGAGFVDIALKLPDKSGIITEYKPKVFVEAKKFGEVPSYTDRLVQTTISGLKIYADWTDEERQVLNYASKTVDAEWAILTNFEKFRLFNARTGAVILNIEKPDEYLERIDDLLFLTRESVETGRIDILETRVEKPDIDIEFLDLMNTWRLKLARNIYKNNKGKTFEINGEKVTLSFDSEKETKKSLDLIKEATQRILDRLVIVKCAQDKFVIDPEQLEGANRYWKKTSYSSLFTVLQDFFRGFWGQHDSRIFEPDHICETVNIDDKILSEVIDGVCGKNFRKFTSDILGNTYESYLGHELYFKEDGVLGLRPNQQLRKTGGIYYTPSYVVKYIVNNTLGKKLEKIWKEAESLFDEGKYEEATQKFKEISKIKVLDSACGSGSFLTKSFELFKEYYERYNQKVREAREKERRNLSNIGTYTRLPNEILDYGRIILKENIYGVDLDLSASEIASVNLVLQSLRRNERLPLILYENVKVGNSLISGVEDKKELDEFKEIEEITELRKLLKSVEDERERKELERKEEAIRKEINEKLNKKLEEYFDSPEKQIKPFNWQVEFPEIFEYGGFDVAIGNPPYFSIRDSEEGKQLYYNFLQKYPYWKKFFRAASDIYYYFVIQKLKLLLKNKGYFGYIIENYWLENDYADRLKELMLNNTRIETLIHFGSIKIFPDSGNDTCILIFQLEDDDRLREEGRIKVVYCKQALGLDKKTKERIEKTIPKGFIRKKIVTERNKKLMNHILRHISKDRYSDEFIDVFWVKQETLGTGKWILSTEEALLEKLKVDGNTIIHLGDKRKADIEGCCKIGVGQNTGLDKVFTVDEETVNKYNLENDLLKPTIKNSHIKRYFLEEPNLYMIYTSNDTDIEKYPNVYNYLKKHKGKLEERHRVKKGKRKWYAISVPQNEDIFDAKEKIVVPYRANENTFAYDNKRFFNDGGDVRGICLKKECNLNIKYILGLLNSKLLNFWYRKAGKAKGGMLEYFSTPLSKIPIRNIDFDNKKEKRMHDVLVKQVDRMLVLNKQKYWLLVLFKDLVKKFRQDASGYEPLSNYYTTKKLILLEDYTGDKERRKATTNEYSIDMIKSEELIEYKKDGKVIKVDCEEQNNFIILKVRLEGETNFRNMLKIYFGNRLMRKFFHLAIRTYLSDNEKKKYWSKGKIWDILDEIKIPRYTQLKTKDAENSEELMKMIEEAYKEKLEGEFKESPVKDLDLTKIEKEIEKTDNEIDGRVYNLYGLTEEEISQIEGII